ncbi:MAG: TetR/AcrR family transcriptional regulator [Pseudomonadota bacterium]
MSSAGETIARGRPKSESKKEQIYTAASGLFLEHGYDGVSMDQVAIQAGVSKQTVYSHFDSKESLFSACIRNKCEAHQLTPAALDPALPVEQVLHRVVTLYDELFHSDEAIRLKRLLCGHADSNPRLAEIFYAAGPDMMKQTLEGYLQGQVDRGVLEIEDIPTAARQLLYMMQGEHLNRAMLNISGGPSEADNKKYLAACVDLFLRAYRRA